MPDKTNRRPERAPQPGQSETKEKPHPPSKPKSAHSDKSKREERLAKALRDNLRRRKAGATKDEPS